MRNYRTYYNEVIDFEKNKIIALNESSHQHLCKVLRLTEGTIIHIVDNSGGYHVAKLTEISKKTSKAELIKYINSNNESPVKIHLLQSISRGDKMDFTIQKAVELGVTEITPIFTERCGVNLNGERLLNKIEHWQNIVISACLQSYRDVIPKINKPINLDEVLESQAKTRREDCLYINLHPFEGRRFKEIEQNYTDFVLLIGPEGGLSDSEILKANNCGFTNIQLGPRVLRTETAGLTTISLIQGFFGDL